MRREAHLLGVYVRRALLSWMAGRSFLLTLVANQAVTPLIGLAIWTAALPNEAGIAAYYVALLAVQLLTVSYENHTFSERIYDGRLADDLLRPHPVVLQPLGENVALRVWHLVLGAPLILAAMLVTGAEFDALAVVLALPALALAATARFLFTYLLALSALWTQRAHGVVGLGEGLVFLLGGAAAPVTLLPDRVRPWGEALPFRAMLGFPAEIVAGRLSGREALTGYAWQALWLGCFALGAVAVWRSGARRYGAVGG